MYGLTTFVLKHRALCERVSVAILSVVAGYLLLWQPSGSALLDFSVFWQAAGDYWSGSFVYSSRYQATAFDGRTFSLPYLYPPVLLVLLWPLINVELGEAQVLWSVLNFVLFFGIVYQLRDIARRLQRPFSFAVLLFFCLCFEPFYWAAMLGQVDILICFLLSVFFSEALRGRHARAGAILALASCLKVTPVLLLLPALIRRDLAVLKGFAFALIGLLVLTIFSEGGLTSLVAFVSQLIGAIGGQELAGFAFNFSVISLLEKSILTLVFCLLLLGLCMWWVRPLKGESSLSRLYCYALCIPIALLISPILWFQHFVWLAPLFLLLALEKTIQPEKHFTQILGLYFLLSQSNLFHYQAMIHFPDFTWVTTLLAPTGLVCCAGLAFQNRIREVRNGA